MNNNIVRIAVAGVSGRIGHQLVCNILQKDRTVDVVLSAAFVNSRFSIIGRDVGELVNAGKIGVSVSSSLSSIKDDFDVLIDFTSPEGTLKHLAFCRQRGKAMVIGTTGFSDLEKKKIIEASDDIAIVFSANFSIGINVILKLLEKTAKIIGKYSDIEIIDIHHRHKIDAPSGTALAMKEVISNELSKNLQEKFLYDYEKNIERNNYDNKISFSVIRAGDVIGEHTAMFTSLGERLEITHRVSSRAVYANGAIKSALWLKGKKSGFFGMKDVLGLTNL